jgi:hypothetical protein
MPIHGLEDPGWAVEHPDDGWGSQLVVDDLLAIPFKLLHLQYAEGIFRKNGDVFHGAKLSVECSVLSVESKTYALNLFINSLPLHSTPCTLHSPIPMKGSRSL